MAAVRADDWIRLQTPHFTVLSEASESRTRAWATEFELFRRAIMMVLPVDQTAVEPVTLILFRSDRRLRPFKPMEGDKPSKIAGFFIRAPTGNFIAIAIEGARDDVRELVFHEAVHWHLAASDRALPLWLEEGLGEVFGNFRLSGNSFFIGAPRPDYVRHVRVAKPMPFAQMEAMGVAGLGYNGKHADLTQLFYAQSWVLAHALFFSTKGVGMAALTRYIGAPPADDDYRRDLEKGLGISLSTLDQQIADYLERGKSTQLNLPLDRKTVDADMKLAAAPEAEVDLALGCLLVGIERTADAEPYLARAQASLPNNPRALEALAAMSLFAGRPAEARVRCNAAMAQGYESFLTHYILAETEIVRGFRRSALEERADFPEITRHLLKAVQLNRRFMPGYETIGLLAPMAPEVAGEIEVALAEGARRYPASARIQLGLAFAKLTRGDLVRARIALGEATRLASPKDPVFQSVLQMVRQGLEEKGGSFQNLTAAVPPSPGTRIDTLWQSPTLPKAQTVSGQIARAQQLFGEGKWTECLAALDTVTRDPLASIRMPEIIRLRKDAVCAQSLAAINASGDLRSPRTLARLQQILDDNPSPAIRSQAEAILAKARESQ